MGTYVLRVGFFFHVDYILCSQLPLTSLERKCQWKYLLYIFDIWKATSEF